MRRKASEPARESTVFNQASLNTIRDASINATAASLGTDTSYDVAIPDLSGVAGWRSAYDFRGLTTVAWSIGAVDWMGATRTDFRPCRLTAWSYSPPNALGYDS